MSLSLLSFVFRYINIGFTVLSLDLVLSHVSPLFYLDFSTPLMHSLFLSLPSSLVKSSASEPSTTVLRLNHSVTCLSFLTTPYFKLLITALFSSLFSPLYPYFPLPFFSFLLCFFPYMCLAGLASKYRGRASRGLIKCVFMQA